MRALRLLAVPLVVAAAVASAPPASGQSVGLPDSSNAGRVQLAVHGLGGRLGGEARVYLTDRYAVGVVVDRSAFTSGDPSTSFPPFRDDGGGRALTVSLGVESTAAGLLGLDWLRVGVGYQAYYQRQEDAVVVAFDGSFEPVLDDEDRQTDGAGLAVTYRLEAGVLGPVQVGFASGGLGLGVRRVRGGTVRASGRGVTTIRPRRETSVRLGTGGGTPRLYVSVRL